MGGSFRRTITTFQQRFMVWAINIRYNRRTRFQLALASVCVASLSGLLFRRGLGGRTGLENTDLMPGEVAVSDDMEDLWFQDVPPTMQKSNYLTGSQVALKKYQKALYGEHWAKNVFQRGPFDVSPPWQFVVLGFHNSGASMTSRLLMLMGLWAGEPKDLYSGTSSLIMERADLTALNKRVMARKSQSSYPSWLGIGWDHKSLSPQEIFRFQREAKGIVRELEEYPPWVLKDALLCWTIPLWMEILTAPACVLTYRHPISMAAVFEKEFLNSSNHHTTARVYLEQWHRAMLSSIRACVGVPTLLIPSVLSRQPTVHWWFHTVTRQLGSMGQLNATIPSVEELKREYVLSVGMNSHVTRKLSSSSCAVVGEESSTRRQLQLAAAGATGGGFFGDWQPPQRRLRRSLSKCALDAADIAEIYLQYWGHETPKPWIPRFSAHGGSVLPLANNDENAMIQMWEEMLERVVVSQEDLESSEIAQIMLDKYEKKRTALLM